MPLRLPFLSRTSPAFFFFFSAVGEWKSRVSCIPGWPWTCYVAEDDLKQIRSPGTSQGLGLLAFPYTSFLWHWGSNPGPQACWQTLYHLRQISSPGPAFWTRRLLLLDWSAKSPGVGNKSRDATRCQETGACPSCHGLPLSLPVSSRHTLWPGRQPFCLGSGDFVGQASPFKKPPDQGIFLSDAWLVSFSRPPGLLPPQHPSRQQARAEFWKWKPHNLSCRKEAALAHIPIAVKQKNPPVLYASVPTIDHDCNKREVNKWNRVSLWCTLLRCRGNKYFPSVEVKEKNFTFKLQSWL